jgi:hypothetical protein
MKKILMLSVISIFFGCVNKSDYEIIEKENRELKSEIENLRLKVNELENNLNKKQNRNNSSISSIQNKNSKSINESIDNSKYFDESEALNLVQDYYDFYNADFAYKNPRVRRMTNNKFRISLKECINKEPFLSDDFHWSSVNYILTINNNGKYTMNRDF